MAMFQHVLADAGLVVQMPEHRSLVEAAVEKHGLGEWKNECSVKPQWNIGLVELLCVEPEWTQQQWVAHRVKGTKVEVREGQTPKKGEDPAMRPNTARMDFLEKTDLIVRAVAEQLGVDPTPKDLTKDSCLPEGGYIYLLRIADCGVFKLGHFQSNKKLSAQGNWVGKESVWERYSGRGEGPSLRPHAEGKWSRETVELHALVSGAKLEDEQALQKALREMAKGGAGYLRSPGVSEMHDLRLMDFALQEMGKFGTLNVAGTPPYMEFAWAGPPAAEDGDEAVPSLSDSGKSHVLKELKTGKSRGHGAALKPSQIRSKVGLLRTYYQEPGVSLTPFDTF
jgi:hypothetical protein